MNDVKKHESQCLEKRTCVYCFKISSTPQSKKRHEQSCKKSSKRRKYNPKRICSSYTCRTCYFTCKDKSILYAHQKVQHGGKKNLQNFTHKLDNDKELQLVYQANKDHILGDHEGHKGINTYNFPVSKPLRRSE